MIIAAVLVDELYLLSPAMVLTNIWTISPCPVDVEDIEDVEDARDNDTCSEGEDMAMKEAVLASYAL